MHEGKVFVRITGSNLSEPLEQATTLHAVEQWLNNEVAVEAYKKFKVGLRVHLSFGGIRQRNKNKDKNKAGDV